MLKNSYLLKYKINSKNLSDFEKKILSEDGNYIMNLQRPLSLKTVNKFPNDKLRIFIDDIMSNEKINNLLYSTTYKEELDLNLNPKKSNSTGGLISQKSNKISKYQSLYFKKQKSIMIDTIKDSISNFKLSKSLSMSKMKIKNLKFFKNQQKTEKINRKLFFKPINDVRYEGYQRAFETCLEKSKSNPKFNLPDVNLNIDNPYSRLYHNMVFYPIKLKHKKKFKIKIMKNKTKKSLLNLGISNNIKINRDNEKSKPVIKNIYDEPLIRHKYKIRNIFREYIGKQFLVTKSFSNRKKCWEIHSGGPGIKEPNPGKINLNKFKNNNSKEKSYFSCDNSKEEDDIIDVNDYRDKSLNSNLHLAVKNNSEEFVKYFLSKNFNPNEKNKFGDTPLHYAMEIKNKKIIQLLIDDGGDLYLKNKRGISPCDMADKEIKAHFKLGNYI